jgi:TPR repeat protein
VLLTPHLARRLASQIAGLFVFNLLVGLTIPGIDNAAHVGGFGCGLALGWVSASDGPRRRGPLVPLVAGTVAVLLAASAVWPVLPAAARLRAYDLACRGGAGAGCVAAGREVGRGGSAAARTSALSYFERACAAGARGGCAALAHALLAAGQGGQRAVAALTGACSAGDPRSCVTLAAIFERGLGVDRDPARAAHWLAQACERQDAASCLRLGEAYRGGLGVSPDDGKAAAAFSRACDLGAAAGCALYGNALVDGAGVARDPGRAASVYARACQGGHLVACARGGTLMEQGHDARAVDPHAAAAALYERGCALGDAASCFNLGALVGSGRGRGKDPARARELYRQACALGMRQVCGLLALWDAPGARHIETENKKLKTEREN